MNNIYSEFLNAKLNFDRVVTDTFELPYQWNSIEIQPNEIATSDSFNLKIKKLYSNLLYLYGLCNISDYRIPKTYTGVIGLSTSKNDILSARTITLSGGLIFSTGNNDRGQLGGGTGVTGFTYNSFQIPTNLKFEKVVGGSNFAFGLTANALYAVGDNAFGQLGISDSTVLSSSEWFQLTGSWNDVACGDFHTLALSSGGPGNNLLYGCGRNSNNQLGSSIFATATYTFLSLGSTFNSVFAGPATSFALTAGRVDGINLYGAGNASSYQFGDGNNSSFTTWRTLTGDWTKIAPGESHTVFLSTVKLVYVAGDNTYGQLGIPSNITNSTYTRLISGVYNDITVGSNHTFLLSGTKLFSAGLNDRGQLGLGIASDSTPFSAVQGDFMSVKAKSSNTYAISTNGLSTDNVYYSILACGSNTYGQLGAGSNLAYSNKFLPASGGNFFDVYPGGNFAFALSGTKKTTTTTLSSLSAYVINNFYYSPTLNTIVPFVSSRTAFGVNDSFDAVTFLPKNSDYTTILLVLSRDYITILGIDTDNKPKELGYFNLINPVSGTLYIENLKGGVTDGEKYFYFTDNVYNNVFYFDLEGFYSKRTFKNKQYLVETLAGYGGRYDNIKLNNPGQLAFTGEKLIVEDTGNQAFKVYDKNLNWLATSTPISIFREVTSFNTMEYNKVQNKLYACSNKKMFIFDFLSNNTLLSCNSVDFSNLLTSNENIKKIKFSSYDSEIYFILTNKKLIKRWTTKNDANIGIYLNDKDFNGFDFRWLTAAPSNKIVNQDDLYLYCNTPSSSANFIATYQDNYDLITILKDKDIKIYTEQDLFINPDEYNTSWVYNKSFKKLLYNMVLFNSSIIYRFVQNADVYNTPILVDRVYNDTFLEKAQIDINSYAVIGINENFQAATLNRCLKLIYDYQQDLLNNVVTNNNITVNLSPGRLRKANPYNPVVDQLNLGSEDLLSLLTEFGIYLVNE
jgi:alpha-tubulin suppressor-like RCC1 family protein